MDEHSRLGIKTNYRKVRFEFYSLLTKALQYLENARAFLLYKFHLGDLY
jgi:hypothetical protein